MPDYTTLFAAIGKYIKAANQLELWADSTESFSSGGQTFSSADALLSEFASVLDNSADDRERLDRIADLLASVSSSISATRRGVIADLDRYLLTVVRDELGDTSATAAAVCDALARSMLADAETVTGNDVGASTPGDLRPGGNTGDGLLAVSTESDDGTGSLAGDPRVADRAVTVRVVRDAPRDRVNAGNEEFLAQTDDGLSVSLSALPATAFTSANPSDGNRVNNGAFASFDTDVPDGFAVAAGTPGTHILEETGDTFVDGASLNLVGDGIETAIVLTQDLADLDPPLIPGDLVVLSAAIKSSGITTGTIRVELTGTGYSATNAIEIASAWPTAWTQLAVFELLPRPLPPDLQLRIAFEDTPNAGASVWIDHVVLGTPARIPDAGLSLAVISGSEPFLGGTDPDGFVFETTSDDAGVIQSFIRDVYGRGLPSTGGSPTIADSAAL
jgi:hypothetical protein